MGNSPIPSVSTFMLFDSGCSPRFVRGFALLLGLVCVAAGANCFWYALTGSFLLGTGGDSRLGSVVALLFFAPILYLCVLAWRLRTRVLFDPGTRELLVIVAGVALR